MNWTYYTFDATTGHLVDESGHIDIFDATGRPMTFASAQEADDYLETNDIRGNVR